MNLLPSTEQAEIVEIVRRAFSHFSWRLQSGVEATAMQLTRDTRIWETAAEMGLFGIGLPQSVGGSGASLSEEILIQREVGRSLVPGPYLSSMAGAHVLRHREGRAELDNVLSGDRPIGLAVNLQSPEPSEASFVVGAERGGLVLALEDGYARLYELAEGAVDILSSFDPTVACGRVQFDSGKCIAEVREQPIISLLELYAASQLCGVAEKSLSDSVAYAKSRTQFGTYIGTFQAVKHRCADMAIRAEGAWALTCWASLTAQQETNENSDVLRKAAVAVASRAAIINSEDNIQNHGGIGFTAEHSAHVLLRRGHFLSTLCRHGFNGQHDPAPTLGV